MSVAREAGAWGFVSKDSPAADVLGAVKRVADGQSSFPPAPAPASDKPPHLSHRERDVLNLIAAGSTNREIAGRLYLSPHTVKQYTSAVYKKLSVRNRTEAVLRAQRLGIIN
jgi:two-component system response regulator DesR